MRWPPAVACLLAIACGGASKGPAAPSTPIETLELRLQTARFRIFAGQASEATVTLAADRLEDQYPRVLGDFGIGEVATVTVRIWQDMVRDAYPTLQQLNAGPNASRQVYEIGYVLGEFIVTWWGRPALLRLIQTNADVQGVLGLSPTAFEEAWYAWVRQRYLQ